MAWNLFRRRNRQAIVTSGSGVLATVTASVQQAESVSEPPPRAAVAATVVPAQPPGPGHVGARPTQQRDALRPAVRPVSVFDYLDDPDADDHPARRRQIGDVDVVRLSDDGRLAVVGESYYQAALRIAADGRAAGDDITAHIPATALLVPEPGNPFDRKAVRIDVLRGEFSIPVGYLSRENARDYQRTMMELKKDGKVGSCPARITGGGRDKYYGIYLHVAEPEWVLVPKRVGADRSFARVREESVLLNAERTCTVTREEDHQDVLRRHHVEYRDIERPGEFVLAFCEATKGRYSGERVVEVRIGTDRVGELTMAMSSRYAELVDAAHRRGATALAHGHIAREERRGLQVTLHMPRDPALPRWYER